MQYNQPYGMPSEVHLGDYPYINGDPTVGRAGSIPPGASIEYDQREVVRVIQWAFDNGYTDQYGNPCLAPTNTYLDQLLKAMFGIVNSRLLRAPKTYYVDNALGSDTLYDGSSPTVSGSAGPFQTIDHALNLMKTWNLNGYDFYIRIAAGTYTAVHLPLPNGSTAVHLIGPTVVFPNQPTAIINGINDSAINNWNGGNYAIQYLTLGTTGSPPPGNPGACLNIPFGHMGVDHVCFMNSVGPHLMAYVQGAILADDMMIGGSAPAFMQADWGCSNLIDQGAPPLPTLTIINPVTFSVAFCWAGDNGTIRPRWSVINNKSLVTGSCFNASGNGVINTQGSGLSYLPGTTAGVTSTGGQYL